MRRWIGTANQGFSHYAMDELRRIAGVPISFQQLVPGESFLMSLDVEPEELNARIARQEPVFLRHLQTVERVIPLHGNADDMDALGQTVRNIQAIVDGRDVAVHIRRTADTMYPYSAADTKALIDALLLEMGAEPEMQQPELILALFAGKEELLLGWGTPEEQLSDWPGGAVRFQREEGQISRAKFKLLEAERTFGLSYSDFRQALDIGAAPGGWTSLLLERGLKVTAIDPAAMHASLEGHPALVHLKMNAADAKLKQGAFDLLVCDMSWSPMQMCKLVLELREALVAGGTAIITVKLMHRKPLQTIRDVIERLESGFQVRRAKQLFHNRDEITLLLERKP